MKKTLILCCAFLMSFCNKKETVVQKKKHFEMYKMSEMALLMEQMYVENTRLKQRIVNNEPIGKFPAFFEKMPHAQMTDTTENDIFFKENTKKFIYAQKLIYKEADHTKKNFNSMVNSCITCHELKCGGPIVKIKKLYIN